MATKSKIRGGEVGSIKNLKKSLKRSSGGTQFLRRIPEDGINVRFLTEPDKWVEYFEHYDDTRDGSYYYPCSEECEGCENNLSKSKRYLTNALDLDDGNKVVPLVLPTSLAGDLMKRYDRFSTLMDRDYELSKEGTGMSTEYSEAYEAPSKRKLDKYDLLDLWAILQTQLNGEDLDDEDDEDEDDEDSTPAVRTKRRRTQPVPKKSSKRVDDDDEDDEDDEDEAPRIAKKRPVKKAVSKRPVKKPTKKVVKKKTLRK